MKEYKIWYDAQENKYYLKINGEDKIEISKKHFYILKQDIEETALLTKMIRKK